MSSGRPVAWIRIPPPRWQRRKRAAVLLTLGGIYVLTGWALFDTAALTRAPGVAPAYAAHLDVMGMQAWGCVFAASGLLAMASVWRRGLVEWAGFAVLQLLALFWGMLFMASYLQTGYGRAWIGLLQWVALAALLVIISDWEDPPADPGAAEAVLAAAMDARDTERTEIATDWEQIANERLARAEERRQERGPP